MTVHVYLINYAWLTIHQRDLDEAENGNNSKSRVENSNTVLGLRFLTRISLFIQEGINQPFTLLSNSIRQNAVRSSRKDVFFIDN